MKKFLDSAFCGLFKCNDFFVSSAQFFAYLGLVSILYESSWLISIPSDVRFPSSAQTSRLMMVFVYLMCIFFLTMFWVHVVVTDFQMVEVDDEEDHVGPSTTGLFEVGETKEEEDLETSLVIGIESNEETTSSRRQSNDTPQNDSKSRNGLPNPSPNHQQKPVEINDEGDDEGGEEEEEEDDDGKDNDDDGKPKGPERPIRVEAPSDSKRPEDEEEDPFKAVTDRQLTKNSERKVESKGELEDPFVDHVNPST